MNPLLTTVLDLDHALGPNSRLLLGGGLGLYLKHVHLQEIGTRTLLPFADMPDARTTQDIDLLVRSDVFMSVNRWHSLRDTLQSLGFSVLPSAKFMKFEREVLGTKIVLDVMVGPTAALGDAVERNGPRVKPVGGSGLHARGTDDALGVEYEPMAIPVVGNRRTGESHSCEVFVPRAFPYALMKLHALKDRIDDESKLEGRHHAMDLYRITGLLTEDEERIAKELAQRFAGHKVVIEGIRIVNELLKPRTGVGRLRLREPPNSLSADQVNWLVKELERLLLPADAV